MDVQLNQQSFKMSIWFRKPFRIISQKQFKGQQSLANMFYYYFHYAVSFFSTVAVSKNSPLFFVNIVLNNKNFSTKIFFQKIYCLFIAFCFKCYFALKCYAGIVIQHVTVTSIFKLVDYQISPVFDLNEALGEIVSLNEDN